MKKSFLHSSLVIILILSASLVFAGCVNSGSGQKTGSQTKSQFVLLDDARQVKEIGEDQTMYQTNSSLSDVLVFYREKMTAKGLTERDLLTVQSDSTLNLVFDGSENGKALVIQAVILDDSNTNVTVRFEAI